MTEQEIFDRVWQHFIVGGAPFSLNGRKCAYRGVGTHNGVRVRCAVGLFISDDNYDPLFEGVGLGEHTDELLGALEPGCEDHENLLYELQQAHDICALSRRGDVFRELLVDVAQDHGLQVPSD